MANRRTREAALVRAEHGEAPLRLDKAQKSVLDEALRRGEDLREEVEAKVTSYGRWLLSAVFGDDAALALDAKSKNPVWLELVRRAGGPTLRVSRKTLYVAVSLAALDKRIADQHWRGLDAGRKELLLPLGGETDKLRDAAKHVSRFNLTQPDTRAYVATLLEKDGKSRQVRITAPRLVARVRTLREGLEKASVLRKLGTLGESLSDEDRASVAGEIEQLREVLDHVARAVRGKTRSKSDR